MSDEFSIYTTPDDITDSMLPTVLLAVIDYLAASHALPFHIVMAEIMKAKRRHWSSHGYIYHIHS